MVQGARYTGHGGPVTKDICKQRTERSACDGTVPVSKLLSKDVMTNQNIFADILQGPEESLLISNPIFK